MRTRSKIAAVALVGAAGIATAGAAGAGSDDADGKVTGPAAEAAADAALAATDGGTVDAVERDDEANGAIWEVEVTKPDGAMVEVSLDADNRIVAIEQGDSEAEGGSKTDGD